MLGPSEFCFNKFGTSYLMSHSYNGPTYTRELWDRSAQTTNFETPMTQVVVNLPDEPWMLISPVRANDILANLYPGNGDYELTDYYLVIENDSKVIRKYEFTSNNELSSDNHLEFGTEARSYNNVYDTDLVVVAFTSNELIIFNVEEMILEWSHDVSVLFGNTQINQLSLVSQSKIFVFPSQ